MSSYRIVQNIFGTHMRKVSKVSVELLSVGGITQDISSSASMTRTSNGAGIVFLPLRTFSRSW